jgi:hypothetical protein
MIDIDKIIKENYHDLAEYKIEANDSMIMLKKSTLKSILESELKKNRVTDADLLTPTEL